MQGLIEPSLEEVGEILGIRFLFREIVDGHFSSLLGEGNRHSATNTTVTTCNQSFPVTQTTSGNVAFFAAVRRRWEVGLQDGESRRLLSRRELDGSVPEARPGIDEG